jgi:hypothetical protein
MIEVIKVGETGITRHVETLMTYINENPNEFVSVGRVDDRDNNYSFIALFRDKHTVGKFSALVHEWGTNDGMSGEGGSGFRRMNQFIEENNLPAYNMTLDSQDIAKIGYFGNDWIENWDDRKEVWNKYANMLKERSGY